MAVVHWLVSYENKNEYGNDNGNKIEDWSRLWLSHYMKYATVKIPLATIKVFEANTFFINVSSGSGGPLAV